MDKSDEQLRGARDDSVSENALLGVFVAPDLLAEKKTIKT